MQNSMKKLYFQYDKFDPVLKIILSLNSLSFLAWFKVMCEAAFFRNCLLHLGTL